MPMVWKNNTALRVDKCQSKYFSCLLQVTWINYSFLALLRENIYIETELA